MESYGKILLYAIPAFLLLVLFEKWYGWWKGNDTVRNMDMISSLSSGITNVTKDVLGLSIAIVSYSWLEPRISIFRIESTIWTYVIAFIVLDFAGYWVHRWSHHINMFWNRHIIHHSSEEFNLACALRQSISAFFEFFTFLLIPAALAGVPANVIAVVAPLHLFAQFWYHTRHIGKLGFLEKIIVTPSHHRVHHAINPEYLDKNLSQIFIVWDKLFGTFQEELDDVKPVYGITRPARTWNPIRINFQHFILMAKDAWRTRNWKDRFRIWFKPTGWRPPDVEERFPVYKIEDVYNFEKYDPPAGIALQAWSWMQLMALLAFIIYLFGNIAAIGIPDIFLYGAFIFLSVYALTELMDRNPFAPVWELLKNMSGIAVIYFSGDWFGLSAIIPGMNSVLTGYFITATLVSSWLAYRNYVEDKLAESVV